MWNLARCSRALVCFCGSLTLLEKCLTACDSTKNPAAAAVSSGSSALKNRYCPSAKSTRRPNSQPGCNCRCTSGLASLLRSYTTPAPANRAQPRHAKYARYSSVNQRALCGGLSAAADGGLDDRGAECFDSSSTLSTPLLVMAGVSLCVCE